MLRYLFAFIVLMHSLIHFIGYSKAFANSNVNQFTRVSKTEGVLWILTALLFIAACILIVMKREWWMAGIAAVLFSRTLITLSWKDAKCGTMANIIILIPLIVAYANWQFNKQYRHEKEHLLSQVKNISKVVTEEMLSPLPTPVQKWLRQCNIIGKEMIRTVYIKQKGMMRTKRNGEWMPFEAEQYNTIEKPSFLWLSKIEASPFLFLVAKDKYENAIGNMLIKANALIPVASSKGTEMDQGSLLRYLGEIQWFPTAALSSYIQWEAIDDTSAKAIMSYGNITASAIYHFTTHGELTHIEANRYYSRGKAKATLEKWVPQTVPHAIKEVHGIRIPYKGEVTWKLKEGDFTWLTLELAEVKYNVN